MSYANVTKEAKLAARDNLRAEKVSKWTGRKSSLEREIKEAETDAAETIARIEKKAAVVDFEATNTPEAHPNKTEIMEKAAKNRERAEKDKEEVTKDLAAYKESAAEKMKEIDTAIAEWEEGKRLVSKDDLKTLAGRMLEKHYTESFLNGDYSEAAKTETAKKA